MQEIEINHPVVDFIKYSRDLFINKEEYNHSLRLNQLSLNNIIYELEEEGDYLKKIENFISYLIENNCKVLIINECGDKKIELENYLEFFYKNKIILDPHTAVGIAAERKKEIKNKPVIYISTAHPAKFPETITKVIKKKINLPKKHKSLLKLKENYKIVNLNYNKIKNYLIKESSFVRNV